MFDGLTDLVSDDPATYLLVLLAAAGDVLFPIIPSETIVITAAVLAARGELDIGTLYLVTATGAVLGDHLSYGLGRWIGDPVARRLFRGERGRRRLQWGEQAIQQHGPVIVMAGRLLPGGRTAGTFAAGTLDMPWRRFAVADVAAALLWAAYATSLGYLGGAAFTGSLWRPLALSLGLATVLVGATELWRRRQRRRGRDFFGSDVSRGDRTATPGGRQDTAPEERFRRRGS